METINKISIIIPTWNSMPELQYCIESIRVAFPRDVIHEIIVVDKYSTDNTVDYLRSIDDLSITVLFDNKTLGSARLKALHRAKTNWVCFVDSDIVLTPSWFNVITRYIQENTGMIFGVTMPVDMKVRKEKILRFLLKQKNDLRFLKKGERGFTHNTIVLRKPLLECTEMKEINTWEDYIITQKILEKGYDVIEAPVFVHHYVDYNHLLKTEAKAIRDIMKIKGVSYTFMRMFFWLYWGLHTCFSLRNLWYLYHNLKIFTLQFKAFLGCIYENLNNKRL